MKNFLNMIFGFAILLLGCIYIGFQFKSAYLGYSYHIGLWPFFVGVALLFFLPPIGMPIMMVGSFLGAYSVWEWPWYGALVWACPLIILMIPAFIVGIKENFSNKNE